MTSTPFTTTLLRVPSLLLVLAQRLTRHSTPALTGASPFTRFEPHVAREAVGRLEAG